MERKMRQSLGLLMLAALFLLGGCASWQTHFDHEAELLAKRGEPSRVWENEDGSRTLEYATQPMGESGWMYTVDENGLVVEQHDALDHANLAKVRAGMSQDEVVRMLGRHRSIERFPRMNEEVWDWNVSSPYPGIIATYFNVHFVEGEVSRTSFTYIYPNDFDGAWFHGPRWGMGYGPAFVHGPWWPHYGPRFGWYGRYGWGW